MRIIFIYFALLADRRAQSHLFYTLAQSDDDKRESSVRRVRRVLLAAAAHCSLLLLRCAATATVAWLTLRPRGSQQLRFGSFIARRTTLARGFAGYTQPHDTRLEIHIYIYLYSSYKCRCVGGSRDAFYASLVVWRRVYKCRV